MKYTYNIRQKMKKAAIAASIIIAIQVTLPLQGQNYEHLIMYGQSLSTGQQSWPCLSDSSPAGNYMLGDQVWINYGNTFKSQLTPLKSTVAKDRYEYDARDTRSQLSCETPVVAAANYLKRNNQMTNYIATSTGWGGKSIEQLSKEFYAPVHYRDFMLSLEKGKAIKGNIHCPAILFMQGEYNFGQDFTRKRGLTPEQPATADKETYKRFMINLKKNMQTDIQKAYNQTDAPLFVTYQTSSKWGKQINMPPCMAQLEAANQQDDIVCAGPIYPLPHRGGHLDPNGYRWYGEMLGKAIQRTLKEKRKFQPLQPASIGKGKDGKSIWIKFYAEHLPLVMDTFLVARTENYGFEIYAGERALKIDCITIVKDTVVLTSNQLKNDRLSIVYAGPSSKGQGNLRDSDDAKGFEHYIDLDAKDADGNYIYGRSSNCKSLHPNNPEPKNSKGQPIYGQPYPLYNFSLAFCYVLNPNDSFTTCIP